jgi:CSLREA domain-containing protein
VRLLALLLAALVVAAAAQPAFGRTFTVTRADDPPPPASQACQRGDCSLREAVQAAKQRSGDDTVKFANGLSGETIQLTQGEIVIRGELAIDGPGAKRLAVSGVHSRIFRMPSGRVTIQDVTIKNGRESASADGPRCPDTSSNAYTLGGGILQQAGALRLDHVKLSSNEVLGPENSIIGGGGIANVEGKLVLVHSRVAGNAVTGGAISGGGGILNCVGKVRLLQTSVHDSALSSHAIGGGGGVANGLGAAHNTGQLTLNKSTVELNNVSSEAISGGGGLDTTGGPVTVKGSTINDNSATVTGGGSISDGGGVEVSNAKAEFTNSTIANNLASAPNAAGGGIVVGGTGEKLVLHSVTLVGNIADGPSSRGGNLLSSESAHVLNSIIAKGQAITGSNCDGAVKASGHDLEDADTCGFNGPGDRVNKNPKLRDLAQNGGPTRTMALRRRSPAINHAGVKTSPKRDQRGFKRDPKPDIGAYEFGAKR